MNLKAAGTKPADQNPFRTGNRTAVQNAGTVASGKHRNHTATAASSIVLRYDPSPKALHSKQCYLGCFVPSYRLFPF
jgi:hypothetical protein